LPLNAATNPMTLVPFRAIVSRLLDDLGADTPPSFKGTFEVLVDLSFRDGLFDFVRLKVSRRKFDDLLLGK